MIFASRNGVGQDCINHCHGVFRHGNDHDELDNY
jgi:hypothetical protein